MYLVYSIRYLEHRHTTFSFLSLHADIHLFSFIPGTPAPKITTSSHITTETDKKAYDYGKTLTFVRLTNSLAVLQTFKLTVWLQIINNNRH